MITLDCVINKWLAEMSELPPKADFTRFLAQAMRAAVEAHWEAVDLAAIDPVDYGKFEVGGVVRRSSLSKICPALAETHASFLNERPDTSSGEGHDDENCKMEVFMGGACMRNVFGNGDCPCSCHKVAPTSSDQA